MLPMLLAAQAPDTTSDIVVTGERLRRLRVNANVDRRGRVRRCEIAVSSGDAAIDRQACVSTRDCVATGLRAGAPLADCVDAALIAFVRAERGDLGNENAEN
ncbi:hypothetical protein PX554_02505 [Sphingomonas sp. H39-1-10]|uniref:hypothetical protein n=1 Tax=Sphingomonas pollutisoli TaxID=3030829 RepID=UPI0023BA1C4E|nr:hypothetical protein [Sphingomonas pollutisoli]MDF0486988.1 hypothetical protein [Sphingomonas pollutisoli]